MDKQYRFKSGHGSVKHKLVSTAMLIGSIVFSLLVLEVSLRAYKGEWRYTNFRFTQSDWSEGKHSMAFDPEFGWVPNLGAWGDDITIIEDGVRSNGSGEVPDTTQPILAVGDSYIPGGPKCPIGKLGRRS